MKQTFFLLFTCFLFELIGQNISVPINPNTGNPFIKPTGFFHNSAQLIFGEDQSFSNPRIKDQLWFADVSSNFQSSNIPQSAAWYVSDPRAYDITCLSRDFYAHGDDIYFRSHLDGEALVRYNTASGSMQTIFHGDLEWDFVADEDRLLIPIANRAIGDSTFVLIDLMSGQPQFVKTRNFGITKNPSAFALLQDKIVFASRDTNPPASPGLDDQLGLVLLDPESGVETELLPQALIDSARGYKIHGTALQFYPTDSLLYFTYHYGSPHYFETALFVSAGKPHDAKKLKVLSARSYDDNGGLNVDAMEYLLPQDFFTYEGWLYFYAAVDRNVFKLFKTNGTSTEQVGDVEVTAVAHRYKFNSLQGDSLLMLMRSGSSSQSNNQLIKLDLASGQYRVILPESNLYPALKPLNDSLYFLASDAGSFGPNRYQYFLWNSQTEDTLQLFTSRFNTGALFWSSAVIGSTLYFTGHQNGEDVLMSVDLEGLTGLQEYEEFTWSLFPNPSSGIIHLKTAFPAGRKNFKIFTLLGKEVYESSLIKESRVDLSFLDPGIYLFQWVDEKQQAQGSAQKFVLQ